MKLLLILLLICNLANAEIVRDPAQVRAFRRDHACPATSQFRGACPGWVVDHIIPLCIGGPDEPRNMQWQDKATSLAKDRLEWEVCRKARKWQSVAAQ
jgi:hypothetical protein